MISAVNPTPERGPVPQKPEATRNTTREFLRRNRVNSEAPSARDNNIPIGLGIRNVGIEYPRDLSYEN